VITLVRSVVTLLSVLVLITSTARAQSFFDMLSNYESGLGIEKHTYHSAFGDVPLYYLGGTFGYSIRALPLGSHFALGASPTLNVVFDLFLNSDGRFGLRHITMPMPLVLRFGTDAERFDQLPVGAAIGVGPEIGWYFSGKGTDDAPETDFFGGIIGMAEVSATMGPIVKLRYLRSLTDYTLDGGLEFSQWKVYLMVVNS
jgi:hypothetical protein